MPDECTPKLEFSPDPLSDTTPTYTDVTSYLKEASWNSGISRDLDQPQAGGATFTLRNRNRDWEPEYAAGRFAGNILPLRRFRWSVTADGVSRPQGTYYATSYQVVYPDPSSTESDVVVSCVDGFGIISLYPQLILDEDTTAETYGDVVKADNPIAHFALDETGGSKFTGDPGPDGQYKGANIFLNQPNPVLGEAAGAATALGGAGGYGRARADDVDVFRDAGQFTLECVASINSNQERLMGFGYRAASAANQIELDANKLVTVDGVGSGTSNPSVPGTYHFVGTWDGSAFTLWRNGVAVSGPTPAASLTLSSDANEFFYVAGLGHSQTHFGDVTVSHCAFYDYALSADRIANHATAALSRGYAADTAGDRIAALATHPLWSTASIPAGTVNVQPRMMAGQGTLDEIITTAATEQPQSLFFFNDAGNPDYVAWEDATTIQATLGEQEVQYDDIGLVYDDQIFNQATAGRERGATKTASDTASQAAYSVRAASDLTGLILANDADAAMIAQAVVDRFAQPMYRFESVVLNGAQQNRRLQLLTREIGDTIRIKRRGAGGTANPDIVTRIIGKEKHVDVNKHLTCSWTLARGFSAATATWHLSQSGYSELNQTAILA